MIDLDDLIGYARRWIELHRENKYQREAAKIMQRVVDALESVRAERDAAVAAIERVRAIHHPIEIEPSSTICGECSFRLPNGRYFGKIVEFPCDTRAALDGAPEAVEVFYRSSDIREAVNVLDQLNAEGRVDDFVYDEMRSAIEDIRDCEVVTAVAHDEHVDHSELIAEAREQSEKPHLYGSGAVEDLRDRLADALEEVTK